jgi:hypothetical protein
MPVRIADVVETGPGSAAQVALTDDSFLNMAANSAIRANQYSFDVAKNRRTAIIKVLTGRVRCILFRTRSADSSFRIETDTALATADMLADFVIISKKGISEIAALDRGVTVRSSLPYVVGDVRVESNQRTAVKEKASPSAPVALSPRERKELLTDVRKI